MCKYLAGCGFFCFVWGMGEREELKHCLLRRVTKKKEREEIKKMVFNIRENKETQAYPK